METLVENQLAPFSTFSEFEFTYDEAIKQPAPYNDIIIYKLDLQKNESIVKNISVFFEELEKRSNKNSQYQIPSNPIIADCILELDDSEIQDISKILQPYDIRDTLIKELSSVINAGIITTAEKEAKGRYKAKITDEKGRIRTTEFLVGEIRIPSEASNHIVRSTFSNFSKTEEQILSAILNKVISENLIYDPVASKLQQEEINNIAGKEQIKIKKGEMIIEKGTTVTQDILHKYKAYIVERDKRVNSENFILKIIHSAGLCLILIIIFAVSLYHVHPDFLHNNKHVNVTSALVVMNIILNVATIKIFEFLSPILNVPPDFFQTVIPFMICPIILSVLIDLTIGLYAGFFVAIITAIKLDNSFDVMISGIIISVITVLAVKQAKNYKDYFGRTVISISLTIPIVDIFRFVNAGREPEFIAKAVMVGIVEGLPVAVLCIGFLFLSETVFSINSNMGLLSFCDYNHSLLKRLQLEAPGTYHHSIMVSALAEHAAREIGANPIKARICALFHDVGKVVNSEYFTENNIDGNNLHKDLNPRVSSNIILNHVKEGVAMTLKYKLPRIVIDTIKQHHGNDMVSFFYKRAVDDCQESETTVNRDDYKYLGPLPREKEVVIVALADSCEAASHSLEKPTQAKIESLVSEIFKKKFKDGQLDEAKTTINELLIIKKSFIKTLTTMTHGRISYPQNDDETDLFNSRK
jgi:putative nucleotidyltransferase with HDIG domain